jgi:hypothetical protein
MPACGVRFMGPRHAADKTPAGVGAPQIPHVCDLDPHGVNGAHECAGFISLDKEGTPIRKDVVSESPPTPPAPPEEVPT